MKIVQKEQLISDICKRSKTKEGDVTLVIEALEDIVKKQVNSNHRVELNGLGVFYLKKTKARTGFNPQHPDEIIKVPATRVPVFLPDERLKAAVDPNYEVHQELDKLLGMDE